VKELGAKKVIVNCPDILASLICKVDGVDQVISRNFVKKTGDALPKFDCHFPLMSAPHLLNVDKLEGNSYLNPPVVDATQYIHLHERFNVGIVWAGSPGHKLDDQRSIPVSNFGALARPEIQLISLQREKYPKWSDGLERIRYEDKGWMLDDFRMTAIFVYQLDLLICCDTAIAHLAGAMGVPIWVCLPHKPDWRWGLKNHTTDWYSSMRLFRQKTQGNWAEVFEEIKKELNSGTLIKQS
jgi:hypothetical protein